MTLLTKFEELRIKTDRQLIHLIQNELELGICYVRESLRSWDNRAAVERHRLAAERAYAEASRLLPLACGIRQHEMARLESKQGHLREMLDALAAVGGAATPAERQIAVLAHALWEARGRPAGQPDEDWFRAERALTRQPACVAR